MPRAVIFGGYGLIGSRCVAALLDAGFEVTAIGRTRGMAGDPRAEWVISDITHLSVPQMATLVQGADVVVNTTGALQDGADDSLTAVHVRAVQTLVTVMKPLAARLVHISAAGASLSASTEFLRTKAQGDAAIAGTLTDWVILRPVLVLSPKAYGGTALLRAAASLPFVLPIAFGNSRIQTAHIDDVAQAVVLAARRSIPAGTLADICEDEPHSLAELSLAIRTWLGFQKPKLQLHLPLWSLRISGRLADSLGWLGWKSPLRTTALRVLSDGVRGDPQPWKTAGGMTCRPLAQTLLALPSTLQERQFARNFFAMPIAIGLLSIFWLASGVIAAFNFDSAMAVLTSRGISAWVAQFSVLAGIVADIGLSMVVLWRRWSGRATLAMIAVSCAYLLASLFTAPDLWADPLGPMVKVLPSMMLALWVWLLVDLR